MSQDPRIKLPNDPLRIVITKIGFSKDKMTEIMDIDYAITAQQIIDTPVIDAKTGETKITQKTRFTNVTEGTIRKHLDRVDDDDAGLIDIQNALKSISQNILAHILNVNVNEFGDILKK